MTYAQSPRRNTSPSTLTYSQGVFGFFFFFFFFFLSASPSPSPSEGLS